MARGWESKSVEDQIASAEAERTTPPRAELTPADRDRAARLAALHLARTSALQDLQRACHPRHRALIERTLAHLDAEIETLSP